MATSTNEKGKARKGKRSNSVSVNGVKVPSVSDERRELAVLRENESRRRSGCGYVGSAL
jgi:hypothetical protein